MKTNTKNNMNAQAELTIRPMEFKPGMVGGFLIRGGVTIAVCRPVNTDSGGWGNALVTETFIRVPSEFYGKGNRLAELAEWLGMKAEFQVVPTVGGGTRVVRVK